MKRKTAMPNYIFSEKVATIAQTNAIPALPAIIVEGTAVQAICGRFYLVFQWFDGKALPIGQIDLYKCNVIGELLARIHNTDFSAAGRLESAASAITKINWEMYIQKAKEASVTWFPLLAEKAKSLRAWERLARDAQGYIQRNMVISHRDLDPKNVLWDNYNKPMIIDWEAAGGINPLQELLDVALYWSSTEDGSADQEAFFTVIRSYLEHGGPRRGEIRQVLNAGFLGKLDWLEYNIKRSLWIECSDEEEQKLGVNETLATISAIETYAEQIPVYEDWMTGLF